jgi:hypothetical protein
MQIWNWRRSAMIQAASDLPIGTYAVLHCSHDAFVTFANSSLLPLVDDRGPFHDLSQSDSNPIEYPSFRWCQGLMTISVVWLIWPVTSQ